LVALAKKYDVKPLKAANMPQMEIAAIFLAYCTNYFLKSEGKLVFVLPRSFFSADHHDNTRSGKATGFRLTQLWDLADVSPLFRIPSGVFFAERFADKEKSGKSIRVYKDGINGTSFSGKLHGSNCNLKEAKSKLNEEPKKWYYIQQGKSSAFSNRKIKNQDKTNPYKEAFRLGATLFPRNFYFIEINQENIPDFIDRLINIKTSDVIKSDAKPPWKDIVLSNRVESNFLFRTALAKSILPFALYKPDLVVLPLIIEEDRKHSKTIRILSPKELREEGFLNAAKWFQDAENIWNVYKTKKSENLTANDRINYQKGITSQDLNKKYLVMYNTSGKDANAMVVQRKDFDLEFIVDYKSFVFYTDNFDEANYLTAFFNSPTPNLMMKDFQTRGLFGARDVSRKILDIYYPKFDKTDKEHLRLAELGKVAHQSVSDFLSQGNLALLREIKGVQLGKLRLRIRAHLRKEMKSMDELVRKLIG
jgi:hypothetical protein